MRKHALFAVAFAGLAIAAWRLEIPIWFLFAIFTIYHAYRAWRSNLGQAASPVLSVREVKSDSDIMVLGVLGTYAPDKNDSSDQRLGLYIRLGRHTVFVDIREDKFLEQRKTRALYFVDHVNELKRSLEEFIFKHPEFESRSVSYIGLHSENLEQGEVFWNPEGYTLLRDLTFASE